MKKPYEHILNSDHLIDLYAEDEYRKHQEKKKKHLVMYDRNGKEI